MPRPERGATPAGFRVQLLARLQNRARVLGLPARRLQQRVAFERFLARLAPSGEWTLKGGFALELRYGWNNRATVDIDLRTPHTHQDALVRLRTAIAAAGIGDNFSFDLGEAEQEFQGAPGGTSRIRVIARVAGVGFATFHVDLSSGDPVLGEPGVLEGSDLLAYAGIEPLHFPVYPVVQHLAEMLHAYTLPSNAANTRVKDRVDLVTIAAVEAVEAETLLPALRATFGVRGTHSLPKVFPEPPDTWAGPYRALISQISPTPAATLREGYRFAAAFWNPVLAGTVKGMRWAAVERRWQSARE
ncbi:MAG: nucleotidyl transferase AbiEii/AbiGii toxin family protein [Dehalococcoidia bacterium]